MRLTCQIDLYVHGCITLELMCGLHLLWWRLNLHREIGILFTCIAAVLM